MNSIHLSQAKGNKVLSALSISLITLFFVDLFLSTMSNLIVPFSESPIGLTVFAVMIILGIITSYLLMNRLFDLMKNKKTLFYKYKKGIQAIQFSIYLITVSLLIEILFLQKFYTFNIILMVTIGYGCSIIGSFWVSTKLFVWAKQSKNKFSFLFGLTFALIFVNSVISLALFDLLLTEKPPEVTYGTPVEFNFECNDTSAYCAFKQGLLTYQTYSLMAYILLFWLSSLFLLHYHIKKLGKFKFIILTTLPIILFYFQFFYQYDALYSINEELNFDENFIYAIQVFLLLLLVSSCGLLYGIGLRSVSNLLKFSPMIENYLKMSSLGIVFFIICANSTVAGIGNPPFGIPSIVFIPFAIVLLCIGIYYSIVSISNDIDVRKFIKNSTFNELKIMGNLAQSQMIDNMKVKVLGMSKKYSEEIHQKNKSETMETEEDMKDYLDEAIKIFRESKKIQG